MGSQGSASGAEPQWDVQTRVFFRGIFERENLNQASKYILSFISTFSDPALCLHSAHIKYTEVKPQAARAGTEHSVSVSFIKAFLPSPACNSHFLACLSQQTAPLHTPTLPHCLPVTGNLLYSELSKEYSASEHSCLTLWAGAKGSVGPWFLPQWGRSSLSMI